MKERLQNITQNLSRKRIITILLVCALIVTSIPFGVLGGNTALAAVGSNYGAVIGNTASFNTKNFPDALITDDPANFDMDSWEDVGDENNRIDFGDEDSLEGAASSFSKLPLVITNYYVDEEGHNLWYEVEAAPGYNTPSKLEAKPWVYQNDLRNYDDTGVTTGMPDALLINQTGATYVFDEDGNRISELDFYASETYKLSAGTTLQGRVDYQWQIYSDGQWIDIKNADEKDFRLSFGMVINILDDDFTTKVRVVTTSGSQSIASEHIMVNFVIPTASDEGTGYYSLRSRMATNEQMLMAVANETKDTVIVTVEYVYGSEDGEEIQAADSLVYEVPKGTDLSGQEPIVLPVIAGYDAYLGNDTETVYTEYTINEVANEDITIRFKYWPAKVDYTVIYYWQNVENDDYTEHERYTTQGFTGSMTQVEDKNYSGFYQLLYEDVPIASDGSTVIEVYYDRTYYKMVFDLDGGYGVQPIYARYGTPVEVSNPTKAGYTFVGWDYVGENSSDNKGNGISDQLPSTVPAQHTAYKAIWKEADVAKVTIVYWGENANDENYSYLKSQELYVTPGTELKYGTTNLICSLKEHTHGEGECAYDCNIEEHSHTQSCYKLSCTQEVHSHDASCYKCGLVGHTHSTSCYSGVGDASAAGIGAPSNPTNGTIARRALSLEGKVIFINGTWYAYSGSVSVGGTANPSCGKTESTHTHTDACLGCGKTVHSHTDYTGSCYTLTCGKTVHSHDASCYSCVQHTHNDNCYLNGAGIETDKYTYVRSDTVTVAADGSTVMNVYYDRVSYNVEFHRNQSCTDEYTSLRITAKWGENILSEWPTYNGSSSWLVQGKSSTWQNSIQVMPIGGAKFWGPKTGSASYTAYYYVEALPGATDTTTHNGVKYILHHEDVSVSSGTVTDEERYGIEGFTYKEGTSNGTSYSNAKFYYTRNSYKLVFNDGKDDIKTEMVKYEASLGSYGFTPEAPDLYEPGSVKFDGWYLNPECTGDEYVLSEHTMPADNVLLYAKWAPVTHTVRFFTDETVERTDYNVYTPNVDGQPVQFKKDIQHGSRIEGANVPPDPTRGQYIFVGWFYEGANGEQMWDFDNTTVTKDTDIYAKWSSNTLVPYTVKFVYKDANGKEIEIADRITGSALGGNSKTFEAKGNAQLYAGYQEGYFPTTKSHTIVMDLENPANNTYTFYYEMKEAVPYSVYYVTDKESDNTIGEVTINGVTYYKVAETKTVQNNKKAIVTEKYEVVSGYLPNTYQQTLILDPNGTNDIKDPNCTNIIIFHYNYDNQNGMYVVHYWTEVLPGEVGTSPDGKYIEHSIFEGRAPNGYKPTAEIKDIENYTYNAKHSGNKIECDVDEAVNSETVLELHVYYDRNAYPYKVQYLEEGTNKPLPEGQEPIIKDPVKWESYVTETAIEIEGYTLVSEKTKSIQIRKDDPTDPTVNIITFYYVENKAALTIKKNYPTDTDYSIDENQTFIFTIKGKAVEGSANDKAEAIDMTVTIHGDGEVKITELPAGTYIVTENADWSWRYETVDGVYSKEVTLQPGDVPDKDSKTAYVEFTNERNENNWLDGDHSVVNIFDGNNQ